MIAADSNSPANSGLLLSLFIFGLVGIVAFIPSLVLRYRHKRKPNLDIAPRYTTSLLPIIVVLSWIGICLVFFIFSLITGGAAITGKIVDGRYYLGAHGNYPEVSRGIYVFSALLSAAFGLTLPIFAGVLNWVESRKPIFIPVVWIGFLFALLIGLGFFFTSVRCIISAFA